MSASVLASVSALALGAAVLAKKFNVKVFYVMGKALSGELSCPCDRSCCDLLLSFITYHTFLTELNFMNIVAFKVTAGFTFRGSYFTIFIFTSIH